MRVIKSLGDVSDDQDVNRQMQEWDPMNFIGTSCETLRLSTFGSSCEKLAKLHSPFEMACQKVKTKLSPIPYHLMVVGIFCDFLSLFGSFPPLPIRIQNIARLIIASVTFQQFQRDHYLTAKLIKMVQYVKI